MRAGRTSLDTPAPIGGTHYRRRSCGARATLPFWDVRGCSGLSSLRVAQLAGAHRAHVVRMVGQERARPHIAGPNCPVTAATSVLARNGSTLFLWSPAGQSGSTAQHTFCGSEHVTYEGPADEKFDQVRRSPAARGPEARGPTHGGVCYRHLVLRFARLTVRHSPKTAQEDESQRSPIGRPGMSVTSEQAPGSATTQVPH